MVGAALEILDPKAAQPVSRKAESRKLAASGGNEARGRVDAVILERDAAAAERMEEIAGAAAGIEQALARPRQLGHELGCLRGAGHFLRLVAGAAAIELEEIGAVLPDTVGRPSVVIDLDRHRVPRSPGLSHACGAGRPRSATPNYARRLRHGKRGCSYCCLT